MSEVGNEPTDDAVSLTLHRFPETLALVKLPVGAEVPSWAESSSIFSVTATATETSLICAGRDVPKKVVAVRGLRAFTLAGPLAPTSVGVLVELLTPLAESGVTAFTISTHDTVWILLPSSVTDRAVDAWQRRGHGVEPAAAGPDAGPATRA